MEFNTTQRYRATEPFPLFEEQSTDATSLESTVTQPSSQSHSIAPISAPASGTDGWPLSNATQGSTTNHRHTIMLLEPRSTKPEVTPVRPLSMTAAADYKSLGSQSSHSNYLQQTTMLAPAVLQPKLTQATVVQNWNQLKACTELEYSHLEPENGDYHLSNLGPDEDSTIIDLRRLTNYGQDYHAHQLFLDPSRRMSESTYSMSSNGPLTDFSGFDDLPSLDYSNQHEISWPTFEPSTKTSLEPLSSPRTPHRNSLIQSVNRSRASPVANPRVSPYTLESTRNKRWSTGMYPGQPVQRPAQVNRYSSYYASPLNPHTTIQPFNPETMTTLQNQAYMFPSAQLKSHQTPILYSSTEQYPEAPRPLPSQGLFRLLSSNAESFSGCYSHCADLSDPPDLYSSLSETPSDPPEEDMNPSDPEMVPHEQELRFPGDLYTPKWVRGHGNKREGWCGLCKPGRWLVLKNSAFWYDKSFTHGVSAATGAAFQSPQDTRRTEANLDVWEGLCGSCGDWIALVSSKKKGTTWFRHAYKCHPHPKVKDGPKRRRDVASSRAAEQATSSSSEQTTAIEPPTICVSTPSQQESRVMEIEDDMDIKEEKTINHDSTPISTPHLGHTPISTPQMSTLQTPGSSHQMADEGISRNAVMLDYATIPQSFNMRLESLAEQQHQHRQAPTSSPMQATTDLTTGTFQDRPSNIDSHTTFTFNTNGTFTQNVCSTAASQTYQTTSTATASTSAEPFMNVDPAPIDPLSQFDFGFSSNNNALSQPDGYHFDGYANMF